MVSAERKLRIKEFNVTFAVSGTMWHAPVCQRHYIRQLQSITEDTNGYARNAIRQ